MYELKLAEKKPKKIEQVHITNTYQLNDSICVCAIIYFHEIILSDLGALNSLLHANRHLIYLFSRYTFHHFV